MQRDGPRLFGSLVAAIVVCTATPVAIADDVPPSQGGAKLEVTEGRFRLRLSDRRMLEGERLAGTVFTVRGSELSGEKLRIDWAGPDPESPDGDVHLYGLSRYDAQSEAWVALCRPGPDGIAAAIPIPRDNDPDAPFSITCTVGARGKCVRMGYKPWSVGPTGGSLANHHEACIRMIRADYCGDGGTHTRDGMLVKVWDRIGIREGSADLAVEATWGPHGAVCLSRARAPDVSSLADIVRACPALAERVRPSCAPTDSDSATALLWNASRRAD
jgi:ADYC domain